jgi:hypothetical protein
MNELIQASNQTKFNAGHEYKLNYNPHTLNLRNSTKNIDPYTIKIVKRLAFETNQPGSLNNGNIEYEETKESQNNGKKVVKFLQHIKDNLKNKKKKGKSNDPMIKRNFMHFFKVNVSEFDYDASGKKGISHFFIL